MSTVLLVALILTGGLQTSHIIPVHARESRRWEDTPSLTWRASSFVSNMISLCSLRNNLIEYHSSVVGGWSRAAATAPEEVVTAASPSSHTDSSEAYGASLPETPSPGTYSEPGPDCAEGGWGVSVTTLSSDGFGSLVEVSPAPAHKSPHDPGAMDEPHKDEKRAVSLVYTPKETCWLSEMAQIASSGSSEMQLELEVEAGLVAKHPASTASGAVEGTCQDQAGNVMATQSATMYVTPNGGNEVEIPLLHLEEMTPVEEDRDQANQDIPHHTLRTSRFRLPLKSKFIYPGGLSVLNRIVYTITMGTECSEPLVFVLAVRLQATTPPPEPITPETRMEHSAQPEYFPYVRTLFPPAESATAAVTSSTLSGTSILTWEEDPRLEEEDEASTPTSSRTAVSHHFVTVRHLPEPSGIAHGEPPTVPRSEAQPGEPMLPSFALGPQQLIFEVTGTPNALLQSSTFVLESRFELSSFIEAHTPPKPTIEVSEVSQSEPCVAQQLTLCIEFRTSSGTAVLVADNDPIWFAGMQLPKNRNQRKLPNNRSCVVWDTSTRTGPLDNTTRVESDLPSVSHRVKFFQITSDEARIREPLRITIRAWVLARNSPRHPHCRTDAGQIIQWIRPRSWTYKFRVLTRQDGNGWAEDSALDMRTLWMVMNRSGDENRASSDAPLPVATPNEESNQEEGLPKIPTTRPTREQQQHGKFGLWERVMMGVVAVVILLAILGGTSSSMLKAVASLASDTPPHCHEYHREGSPTSPPSIEVPIEGMSKPPQEESEMTFSSVLGTLTNIPTGTYTLSSIDLSMQDEPPMADDGQTWPPSQIQEEKHGTQDALLRPLQGRNQ